VDSGLVAAIATFASGVVIWFGTQVGVRRTLKSNEGKNRYDQLQEDLNAERATRTAQVETLMSEIVGLKTELRETRAGTRVRDDYIQILRQYIEERKAPPPPPYPDGMN
jgi:hypothetical protein